MVFDLLGHNLCKELAVEKEISEANLTLARIGRSPTYRHKCKRLGKGEQTAKST